MPKKPYQRGEDYSNYIHRLFPESFDSTAMRVRGNHVRTLTMQLTEDCNLRCTYCYQHDKTPSRMSWDVAKSFIDLILASDERSAYYVQSRNCPGCVMDYIGGEPLLEIDLLSETTEYMIKRMVELNHPWLFRTRFSICTNGLLYFDSRVQNFLQKHASHTGLTVTIDGNKKIHDACRIDASGRGSFDRAFAASEHWRTHYLAPGARPTTKITVAPGNLPYVAEAVIEYLQAGYPEININCVFENVWEKKHARMWYDQLIQIADYAIDNDLSDKVYIAALDQPCYGNDDRGDRPWCGGSGLMVGVDTHGDLYPCIRYMPSSIGNRAPLFIIGDVHNGFGATEEQRNRIDQLACVTRSGQLKTTEHCTDCPISGGCADCAAYSYEVFGKVGCRTTYICDMHRARTLAQLYYTNKVHLKNGTRKPMPILIPEDWALEIVTESEFNHIKDLADQAQRR